MVQLRDSYAQITKLDSEVVVIGPENAQAFSRYWKKEKLPFIGIPDSKHSVLKQYGQQVNLFKLGRMPAQMIIDKQGILRYVHYGHSMKDIPSNQEVLSILEQL